MGADVNQRHPQTDLTALHVAAFRGRVQMTQLLIDRGADVNATTQHGAMSVFPTCEFWRREGQADAPHQKETPLHLAMLHQNWEVARLLIEAGADPVAEDQNGDRPIDYIPHWAVYPDVHAHWRLLNRTEAMTVSSFKDLLRILGTS